MLLFVCLLAISPFVLIESREVFQGMLSGPFVTSLLLIYLGYDPFPILLTAFLVQGYYFFRTPSGASTYPEYPFAFFVTMLNNLFWLNLRSELFFSRKVLLLVSFLSLIEIIFFSNFVARLLLIKRNLLTSYSERRNLALKINEFNRFTIVSLAYSYLTGIIATLLIVCLLFLFSYFASIDQISIILDKVSLGLAEMEQVLLFSLLFFLYFKFFYNNKKKYFGYFIIFYLVIQLIVVAL